MALTVDTATTRGRSYHLDDDGTRWTDAEFKTHLEHALDGAYEEFVTAGGAEFDSESGDLTSTSAGVLDVSSINMGQINGLSVKIDNRYYKLHPARIGDREYADDSARTFRVAYSQKPQIGTSGSDPLVSTNGTVQANSWADFEALICLRASMLASIKDGFVSPALREEEGRMLARVMKKVRRPRTRRFPGVGGYYTKWLRWDHLPAADEIIIHKKLS